MAANSQSDERRTRYQRGRFSELLAAGALMARGFRILGRRVRTPYGEIDLIAVRGAQLTFVEVKHRESRLEGEAALTLRQAARVARAAEFWVARNPRYRDHDVSMDALLISPGRLPRHLPGALNVARSTRR